MQKMGPFQKFYFIIFMQTEHPGKKKRPSEKLTLSGWPWYAADIAPLSF